MPSASAGSVKKRKKTGLLPMNTMRIYSIRNRILIWLWGMLAFAVALPILYLAGILRQEFIDDANTVARSNLIVAEWLLHSHPPFQSFTELNTWMERYTEHTGQRLSYIIDGQVQADSHLGYQAVAKMPGHDSRPEVLQAISTGFGIDQRISTSLNTEMIYVAKPVTDIPGVPPGILRLSRPVSEVLARFSLIMDGFALVFGACFIASILVTYFGMHPLMGTLRSMADTARAIGRGSYDKRIPPVEWEELSPLSKVINTMAENIASQVTEMTLRQEKLRALFNALNEGVMYVNKFGIIEVHNKAATSIFSPLFAGKTLLDATLQPAIEKSYENLRTGFNNSAYLTITMANKKEYEVALVKIRRNTGEVVVVIRDVSEARRVDRMRQEFIATISHELKTPLTSIKGYTETLLDAGALTREQHQEFLQVILRNADHMIKMVGGLLTLAKAEHHAEMLIKEEPVDLYDVIQEVLAAMHPLAEEKQIQLLPPTDKTLLLVEIGADALHEVLRNLVDNAIKYTQKGGIVSVQSIPTDKTVLIRVEDNGPAIGPMEREHIFERFYRTSKGKTATKSSGAGLGLAICQRIIKSFSGDIWLETPVNPGAKSGVAFCFTLLRVQEQYPPPRL